MNISSFGFHLLGTYICTAQVVTIDVRHFIARKRNLNKNAFRPF